MESEKRKETIVILGGGFGGVYTAKYLEKLLKRKRDQYEVILVSRENYFTFQPMLAEVVGGSLGVFDSVSSLRFLLPHTTLYIREVTEIDLNAQNVTLAPNFSHKDLQVKFDHLVLAFGRVTDFRNTEGGLSYHALPFKNLNDAFEIRNRIIEVMETAAYESDPEMRRALLTFVVGGGGFSGLECVAEVNDLVRKMAKKYKTIDPKEIRVMIVHKKDRLVNAELSPSLGNYCAKLLRKRGVEILFERSVISATPEEVILDGNERIACKTIISTVPATPNLLAESLNLPNFKGYIETDEMLKVKETKNIWALGDCAAIPQGEKKFCPPTAQFAIRQGKRLAKNIYAELNGKELKPFKFKALGMMAALGHRRAAAELFGKIKLSGFIAWVFWRFIYWCKLPGFNRKMKVFFSWVLDMIIPAETVQLKQETTTSIKHFHYAKDEYIFKKGDLGDMLYLILDGSIGVIEEKNGKEKQIATLKKGEYFGEMALLNEKRRTATVKCLEDCNLVGIRKADFQILVTNFKDLREDFEATEQKRLKKAKEYLDQQGNIHHIKDYQNPDDGDTMAMGN